MHNPEQAMGFLMYILAEYRKSCLSGIRARNLWASAMDHWTSDVGFQAIRYPRKYKVEKKNKRTCNFFPQHFFFFHCRKSDFFHFFLAPDYLEGFMISTLCTLTTTSTTRVHIWNCSFNELHKNSQPWLKYILLSIYLYLHLVNF